MRLLLVRLTVPLVAAGIACAVPNVARSEPRAPAPKAAPPQTIVTEPLTLRVDPKPTSVPLPPILTAGLVLTVYAKPGQRPPPLPATAPLQGAIQTQGLILIVTQQRGMVTPPVLIDTQPLKLIVVPRPSPSH